MHKQSGDRWYFAAPCSEDPPELDHVTLAPQLPVVTETAVTVRCSGKKFTMTSGDRDITCYSGSVYNYTISPVCEKIGEYLFFKGNIY